MSKIKVKKESKKEIDGTKIALNIFYVLAGIVLAPLGIAMMLLTVIPTFLFASFISFISCLAWLFKSNRKWYKIQNPYKLTKEWMFN